MASGATSLLAWTAGEFMTLCNIGQQGHTGLQGFVQRDHNIVLSKAGSSHSINEARFHNGLGSQ